MSEVPLYWLARHLQRFRGGLVFKAHRLLYHSTLGIRVIKKKFLPFFFCRLSPVESPAGSHGTWRVCFL